MKNILINIRKTPWAYIEHANSIKDALLLFGFNSDIVTGCIQEKADFIFYYAGCNQPDSLLAGLGETTIFIETDHIDTPLRERIPVDYSQYTRSLHWFDYKKDLTNQNIYYCPIGYSKHFDTDIPRVEKRSHFHMGRSGSYGYRDAFRAKFNLWTQFPVIGKERDELIVTSKVNINSRMQQNYWFTPLHASLILCKGKLYMQEDCGKDDYSWYKPYLVLYNENNFKEKLDYWTSHDKERRDFEAFIYEDIKKNHRFEDILYSAIGDLLGI